MPALPKLFGGVTIPGCPYPANIGRLDLLILPQLRRMMRTGIAIDREWLQALSERLSKRMAELRLDIVNYIPAERLDAFVNDDTYEIEFNVNSAEQIGNLLFDMLGVGKGTELKKTKSGERLSTGKKQLETLKRHHKVIGLILEYREAAKLKSTYTDALPQLARWCDATQSWRVYCTFTTTRTATGRLASKKPNLQNIPARSKLGAEVRKGFIASQGRSLISRDFAQIELRLMADRANEPNMLRIFKADGDIHLDTAMRAFHIDDPKKVDKTLHRAPCKNVNFGVAYGLAAPGLYDLMALTYATAGIELPDWLTVSWCDDFILKWFDLYPACKAYFDLQDYRARRYEIVWDALGRVRRVPEVRSVHPRIRSAGLRQAGNMPIQGYAAGVFKLGAARVEKLFEELRAGGIWVEALLPVHDEIVAECDSSWAELVNDLMGQAMESALTDIETGEVHCRVPVKTDGKVMSRWTKE